MIPYPLHIHRSFRYLPVTNIPERMMSSFFTHELTYHGFYRLITLCFVRLFVPSNQGSFIENSLIVNPKLNKPLIHSQQGMFFVDYAMHDSLALNLKKKLLTDI